MLKSYNLSQLQAIVESLGVDLEGFLADFLAQTDELRQTTSWSYDQISGHWNAHTQRGTINLQTQEDA
jgi:hypothetical protein